MTDKENIQEEECTTIEEAVKDEENIQSKELEEVDIEKELNEKYMRLLAEFDNFKKRTQKEKCQIYTDAAADVIEAIIPFIDNLQRASNIQPEGEEAKSLIDGIKLMQKQFEDVIFGLGVSEIESVGKTFDPEFHNAVMHVEDECEPANTIIEEFAKGYKYKEKVIRHSIVKVAN